MLTLFGVHSDDMGPEPVKLMSDRACRYLGTVALWGV